MRSTSLIGLPAANRCFDQVEQRGPAHEPMKGRLRVVEDGPEVTKRLFVPPVAEGGRAARKVRRREERPTVHRLERPLGLRNNGLDILLCSANAR